jgi:hypothetical protein
METLTTSDFTFVGREGVLSGSELSQATKNCSLKVFALSNDALKIISPTVATLTYVANQEMYCDEKPEPSKLQNMDVFVKQRGKWLVSTHIELEIAE